MTTALYDHRFSAAARRRKDAVWRVLCSDFFQQFIAAEHDAVLDIASGLGEFSRHIKARRKFAIDVNPDAARHLPPDVAFHAGDAADLGAFADASIDVCFSSNFFEHLASKADLDRFLLGARRVLRPGGRYVALQPNIRFCYDRYWDFYDHHLPLSDRSCAEAFAIAGFSIERVVPRFLPLTVNSRLPQWPWLVRAYLAMPVAWRLFGEQFVLVARTPA